MFLELPPMIDHLFWYPSRLILPYERFIKGEEDKPLPPIKPRKQENSSQENENKTKVSGTKRIKHEIPKSKKEKENAPKPQESSEVSCCPPQKYLCETGPGPGLPESCVHSRVPAPLQPQTENASHLSLTAPQRGDQSVCSGAGRQCLVSNGIGQE